MNQQDYQGMMDTISSILGPFCGKIIKGKMVIDIPPPLQPTGPLVGFGDEVQIGDWVRVARSGFDSTMPLQVVHYDLRPDWASISLLNRVTNAQFNYQVAGGQLFTVVPLDDVPLYLREAYPRNQTELDTWKMLTKAQILEKYAGMQEALCYAVLFSIPYKRPDPVRPNYVHRDAHPHALYLRTGLEAAQTDQHRRNLALQWQSLRERWREQDPGKWLYRLTTLFWLRPFRPTGTGIHSQALYAPSRQTKMAIRAPGSGGIGIIWVLGSFVGTGLVPTHTPAQTRGCEEGMRELPLLSA